MEILQDYEEENHRSLKSLKRSEWHTRKLWNSGRTILESLEFPKNRKAILIKKQVKKL